MDKKDRTIRKIKSALPKGIIPEKKLGIPPDYQYKAIKSKNFVQANWHKNKLFTIEKLLELSKKMVVLDLGTGSGNFEIKFSNRVKKTVGVDYNGEALSFLDKYLQNHNIINVELIQSDIRRLPKIKNLPKFDLIIMSDVIEHLRIGEVKNLIMTLKNLLKEKGEVFVITPNYKSLWILIEHILDKSGFTPAINEVQHFTSFDRKKLEGVFTKNGFVTEKITTFNFISYLIPLRKISEIVCRLELQIPFPIGNLIAALFTYPKNTMKKNI